MLNYYGFTQVNVIPGGIPTHFKNQLNTRHCLMFLIVKLFRSGWIKDIHRNKFPTFFYRTSKWLYVEKFIASKRTNMSNMLNVFHFAIFHIIIHGILKFNALTFILFWNERLINVSIVTFFTGMRWKFDVNTTAEVACIYLDFPKERSALFNSCPEWGVW